MYHRATHAPAPSPFHLSGPWQAFHTRPCWVCGWDVTSFSEKPMSTVPSSIAIRLYLVFFQGVCEWRRGQGYTRTGWAVQTQLLLSSGVERLRRASHQSAFELLAVEVQSTVSPVRRTMWRTKHTGLPSLMPDYPTLSARPLSSANTLPPLLERATRFASRVEQDVCGEARCLKWNDGME